MASTHTSRWLVLIRASATLAVSVTTCGTSRACQIPEQDVVRFGMSTALTGPAANLGRDMRAGVLAAFEESNRSMSDGGGPRIELVVLDDGYEPSRCAPAVRSLIEEHGVVALVGDVGTPTAVVALPICRETGTLYIGAFTGAALLRPSPPDPIIFNFRASYGEEIRAMVNALVNVAEIAPHDIGFFTQRDAYGDAGFQAGLDALQLQGYPSSGDRTRVVHARYERNTLAVESAVAEFLLTRPKAIIMVGAYAPTAAFVRLCKESGYSPLFLSVSFVGPESLAAELGELGNGVIVTQVVPTLDSNAPILPDLKAALSALPSELRTEPTLGSLEGYVVGRIVVNAVHRCEAPYTPARLAAAIQAAGDFDIGLNADLRFSPGDHQASHRVWPSIVHDKALIGLEWSGLPEVLRMHAPDAVAEEGHVEP